MTLEELKQAVSKHGYEVINEGVDELDIVNQDTRLSMFGYNRNDSYTVQFRLEGPKPPDDVIALVLSFYEVQGHRDLIFHLDYQFEYYHPDYYTNGSWLRKFTQPLGNGWDSFHYQVHQACLAEWKRDPLFHFSYRQTLKNFFLSTVKSGQIKEYKFSLLNDAPFSYVLNEESHFSSINECVNVLVDDFQATERAQRIPLLYQPSSYYTDWFFKDIEQSYHVSQTVFAHFCSKHDWETVEHFFKSHSLNQLDHLSFDTDLRMIKILDEWVLLDDEDDKEVLFYPVNEFETVLAAYKERLFLRTCSSDRDQRILQKYNQIKG